MKFFSTLLLSLTLYSATAQPVRIAIPPTFGIPGGTGVSFTDSAALPVFQMDSILYCKSTVWTGIGNQPGYLFKVNMTNGQPTIVTGDTVDFDYAMENMRNMQTHAGKIYFNMWQTSVYKIDPDSNKLRHVINKDYNFLSLNGKLYFYGNSPSQTYQITTGLTAEFPVYDNTGIVNYYQFQKMWLHNGELYGFANYWWNTVPSTPNNHMLVKIIAQDSVVVLHANTQVGTYNGFRFVNDEPCIINDKFVFKESIGAQTMAVAYDITTQTFYPNVYDYVNSSPGHFTEYSLNNNIYFSDNNQLVYSSDGSNAATLTNLPCINFGGNSFASAYGQGGKNTLIYNNKIFGFLAPTTPVHELRKTDGTLAGTTLILDSLRIYGATVHNGKLYFIGYNNTPVFSIYQYDDNSQTLTTLYTLPVDKWFESRPFLYGNNLFFYEGGYSGGERGLYMLDITTVNSVSNTVTLTQKNITIQPNPVVNELTINNNNAALNNTNAYITDIQGRIIYQFTMASRQVINVHTWPSGMYFLHAEGAKVEKIIKY